MMSMTTCPRCGGTGHINTDPCVKCNGRGTVGVACGGDA